MRIKDTVGISALLGQVDHQLSQKIEQTLRSKKITLPQYSTLSMLELHKQLTNADLARLCYVTPQTMNRLISNLLKTKWIKKSNKKGVKVFFSLTKSAENLLCDCHELVNKIEKQMISQLPKNEFKKLESHLKHFSENLKN